MDTTHDIKIINVYTKEKTERRFSASVHVRILDLGIDIKDIAFFYERRIDGSDKTQHMILPRRIGIDPITQNEVFFLIVQMTDWNKQKILSKEISSAILAHFKEIFDSIPFKEKAVFKKTPFRNRKPNDNSTVGCAKHDKSLWNKASVLTTFASPKNKKTSITGGTSPL